MEDHEDFIRELSSHIWGMPNRPRESTSKGCEDGGLSQLGAAVSAKPPLKLNRLPHRHEIERKRSKKRVSRQEDHTGVFNRQWRVCRFCSASSNSMATSVGHDTGGEDHVIL